MQEWNSSDLVGTIVGTGRGRAFCAGGDVAGNSLSRVIIEQLSEPITTGVVKDAEHPETRFKSENFFKYECVLSFPLDCLAMLIILQIRNRLLLSITWQAIHCRHGWAHKSVLLYLPCSYRG